MMKVFKLHALCFVLLGVSMVARAQIKPVTYDSIPAGGINLRKGWLFSAADNQAFANTHFNDANWTLIDVTRLPRDLPQLKNVNVGWLRLHLVIGPHLAGRALIMSCYTAAAAEVYVDGKRIASYGAVNPDYDKAALTGINHLGQEIHLTPQTEHVIAIRFTPWKHSFLVKDHFLPFITMSITDIADNEQQWQSSQGVNLIVAYMAFFGLLTLLHLLYFRYYPAQRANLYFSAYAISEIITALCGLLLGKVGSLWFYNLLMTYSYATALMESVWLVAAVSSLFGFRTRWLMPVMWAAYVIAVILMIAVDPNFPFIPAVIFFQSALLGLLIRALRTKKRGAGIVAAGLLITVITAIAGEAHQPFVATQLYNILLYIPPALAISIYLSREFALDSKLLQEKLIEVETLSAQTLAQEQEKQQLLARQNDELELQVTERTTELRQSLADLRSTQSQLIQSEKMASLGELTAGIAHEIQNPLNFVNNFSEVNREMLEELKAESEKPKAERDEQLESELINDLIANEGKINHHGKRADAIVKGMLEHSRSQSGQKEPVNINALADEYLRLAYHGLRAKDKTFNADLVTNFDANLPLVNIIPQDIGRVLLNLFNNAFYAVQQRQLTAVDDYKPAIEVTTRVNGQQAELTVKDNGIGIPDSIREKIMQPFFTTKPTGEGTGLGLSLSYDMVVKGHGGSIQVNSVDGEGSEFIVWLPV